MAKGTRRPIAFLPVWPQNTGVGGTAPAFITSPIILTALNDRSIEAGTVLWADGGTHDLRTIRHRNGAALTGTMTLSIRDIDGVNGPPLRDDGVADQSVAHVNPGIGTITSTLVADRTGVATGAQIASRAATDRRSSTSATRPVSRAPR
jgi:hypothetical protein